MYLNVAVANRPVQHALAFAPPSIPTAPLTLALKGTTRIHLVRDRDESFIETYPGFSKASLRAALWLADSFGLEAMPEDECPAELLPGGCIRIYLAQTA